MKISDIIGKDKGKVYVSGNDTDTYIMSVKVQIEDDIVTMLPNFTKLHGVSKKFYDRIMNKTVDIGNEESDYNERKALNTISKSTKVVKETEIPEDIRKEFTDILRQHYKKYHDSDKYLHTELDFMGQFGRMKGNIIEV